jgi:hypothetical protein
MVAATAFAVAALGTTDFAHAESAAGRPVPGIFPSPDSTTLCNIMYVDANYGGGQFTTTSNFEWWDLGWFNDQMSSMKTFSGCNCTIYWDANFLGSSLNYNQTNSGDNNIPWIGDQWNDKTSSIICYGP